VSNDLPIMNWPHLPVAHADVVADAVAEDHVRGALARDVPAALADHHHQLGLIVERARDDGPLDGIIGAVGRGRRLGEPQLVRRLGDTGLRDVVGIVEPDREDLSGPLDRRQQAHVRNAEVRVAAQPIGLAAEFAPALDQASHVGGQAGDAVGEQRDLRSFDQAQPDRAISLKSRQLHRLASHPNAPALPRALRASYDIA
jgi:hypothetical protein